jgi:ribose 1,5-bisphosphate isomerase
MVTANSFNKICQDIKSLKIQGAESVAKHALIALKLKHDKDSIKKLIALRPTEPCLRNCIKFATSFDSISKGVEETLKIMEDARKKVIKFGANLVQNNTIIFTHCHSSTVVSILIEAKRQGKKFEVYNTETRPNFQGRITAKELIKAGIPVTMFIDNSSTAALKEAKLFLFGVDAITAQGTVVNKIGNRMMAEIAEKYDVPRYACSFSWKFDPKTVLGNIEKLESRSEKEVWPDKPKKLKISNIVFEEIPAHLMTGIITELGILEPGTFVSEFELRYPFLF